MVWGVYKLKERRRVDILDDEIRGTLGNFSDKAAPTPRRLIESKALAQVAVRIICLVSPLSLNAGASTPCQDSLNRHRPRQSTDINKVIQTKSEPERLMGQE